MLKYRTEHGRFLESKRREAIVQANRVRRGTWLCRPDRRPKAKCGLKHAEPSQWEFLSIYEGLSWLSDRLEDIKRARFNLTTATIHQMSAGHSTHLVLDSRCLSGTL